MTPPRPRPWLLLALVLTGCAAAGCLAGPLRVVVSAPMSATGLTVAVAAPADASTVRFHVLFHGERIYPPLGADAVLRLQDGRGSAFVPYQDIVRGNGLYTVEATDGPHHDRASATLQKWVASVYVTPYERRGNLVVDAILQAADGGHPDDRIMATGELLLELRYKGTDGSLNETAGTLRAATPANATFTRVTVPVHDLDNWKGPGWYAVVARFHNGEARGNNWVGDDPTLAATDPPRNWVYLR